MPRFDDVRLPCDPSCAKCGDADETHGGTETLLRRGGLKGVSWLVGLCAVLCPVVAWSAEATSPSRSTTQSPASQAADAPPPIVAKPPVASSPDAAPLSPEHIAKARRLILATGISRSFQIIVPEFMDQIGNTLTQARPELVRDMTAVLDQLRPEFEKQSDEMIDLSARIYATLLSENELDAILAFYDSEAGKKYVGAQPLFLNQLVSGIQAWQQKISTNMMARVRQEMKKKGHDL